MALGDFEELAFRLHRLTYFFMWPFPVKWDFKNSKLLLVKPLTKLIPFGISVLYTWLFGWVTLFTALYMCLNYPRKVFGIVNIAIFVLVWGILSTLSIVVACSLKYKDAIVSALNELLFTADSIEEEYKRKRRMRRNEDTYGVMIFLPLCVIPVGAFSPYAVIIAGQYSSWDPGYFLSKELLPDIMYWEHSTLWLIICMRLFANFIVCLEAFRVGTFLFCCGIIAIYRGRNIIKILITRVKDCSAFIRYYRCCILLMRKVELWMHLGLYLVMTMGFWMLVISCWVCVRCTPSDVTLMIYLLFVLIVLVLAGLHLHTLPLICAALDMAVGVIKVHYLRAEFKLARCRTRANKMHLLSVKATAPFRLKYGPFWSMGEDFFREYLMLIVDRTFDAILVIDFN